MHTYSNCLRTPYPRCPHSTWMGWRGKKNGELLKLAATKFNVFVTIDGGLLDQQRVSHGKLGIVALVARRNEIEFLRPLIPALRHAVMKVKPGQVLRVTLR